MGYVFRDEWIAPAGPTLPTIFEADAMHALLVLRADQIEAYTAGSPEETRVQGNRRCSRGLRGQALARWQGARREGLTLQSMLPHELGSRDCQDDRKHDPESIAWCPRG